MTVIRAALGLEAPLLAGTTGVSEFHGCFLPKDPSFHLENPLDSASCPECERELNALEEACVLAKGTRLIVVQGPLGSGKGRLLSA
ncbi:MAG: ATP-binding protein [Sandaracinaceae bacterium]|nr:ATP-binding protein [Sandaracinaceae bacterium]MDW8246415.1 hypothetical protein [Sandaracinaceae bacterium]